MPIPLLVIGAAVATKAVVAAYTGTQVVLIVGGSAAGTAGLVGTLVYYRNEILDIVSKWTGKNKNKRNASGSEVMAETPLCHTPVVAKMLLDVAEVQEEQATLLAIQEKSFAAVEEAASSVACAAERFQPLAEVIEHLQERVDSPEINPYDALQKLLTEQTHVVDELTQASEQVEQTTQHIEQQTRRYIAVSARVNELEGLLKTPSSQERILQNEIRQLTDERTNLLSKLEESERFLALSKEITDRLRKRNQDLQIENNELLEAMSHILPISPRTEEEGLRSSAPSFFSSPR